MLSRTKKGQLKPKLLEVATCDIIRCVDEFCHIKIQKVEYERCIIKYDSYHYFYSRQNNIEIEF